jgi:hypothetical protein
MHHCLGIVLYGLVVHLFLCLYGSGGFVMNALFCMYCCVCSVVILRECALDCG